MAADRLQDRGQVLAVEQRVRVARVMAERPTRRVPRREVQRDRLGLHQPRVELEPVEAGPAGVLLQIGQQPTGQPAAPGCGSSSSEWVASDIRKLDVAVSIAAGHANDPVITHEDSLRIRRKLDWHLLPLLSAIYCGKL